MNPEIVIKESFTIIGLKYEGRNENNEIIKLWQRLSERVKEIKNRTIPNVSYGYDTWTEKINDTGEFTYIAGVKVESDTHVPEGMTCIKVPCNKYAVFTIGSILEDVGEMVGNIYKNRLPELGLEIADHYDFEYYKENFKPNDKNSKIYFFVPIK
ncbi:arginyl-tRNA synthetase protein [Haloplasma contractile SSD-17B]|uniref:Arginyl-tRNA synthetase protein n=1 Tax=Haloplasma contractile SSD-17B TaxID=1033810 RepID=U2E922_9MOLU|nr:arginyl-tRNA synthetase protein [Haloplasma contractile SSD-17B]